MNDLEAYAARLEHLKEKLRATSTEILEEARERIFNGEHQPVPDWFKQDGARILLGCLDEVLGSREGASSPDDRAHHA